MAVFLLSFLLILAAVKGTSTADDVCTTNTLQHQECQCNFNFDDPYLSRVSNVSEVSICPRLSPVVWGKHEVEADVKQHALDDKQLAYYEENGYLLLPDLFSETEINALLDSIVYDYLPDIQNRSDLFVLEKTKQEPIVRSVFEFHKHPIFASLAKDPRILTKAKQIVDSEVYIFQSRLNFQRAFHGEGFSWHSDVETWHCEDGMPVPRALSAVVLLDDTFAHNGALMVIPGSHKKYVVSFGVTPGKNWEVSLVDQRIGGPSAEQLTCLYEDAKNRATAPEGSANGQVSSSADRSAAKGIVHVEGKAGSVLLFDSNLMHGSHNNISPAHRRNMFFVYNSVENKLKTDPYCAPNVRPERLATRDPFWEKAIK